MKADIIRDSYYNGYYIKRIMGSMMGALDNIVILVIDLEREFLVKYL